MDEREAKEMNTNVENMQEEFMKSLDGMEAIKENQLVSGTVIQVDSEYVFIDIGYKSEGKISTGEFYDNIPNVGDKITVFLIKKEGKNGEIVVSKKKADAMHYWVVVKEAFDNNGSVEGVFTKAVNNGLEVELGNTVKAFCPISKAEIQKTEDSEKLVGVQSGFTILKLEGKKVIVSRRDFLKKEIDKKRDEFFASAKEGDVIEGIVKSFTSFGAFIDLGGFDGLLHINDMSWGHVARPKDYVKRGQKIELIVLALDHKDFKINLSLKHFTPDPWLHFTESYNAEDLVKGKVTKLIDFGAFVEIEEGIEGFVHISELSWVKRIKHPKEILSVGDKIEAKILDFDIDTQRISLGVKQVLDNPWDTMDAKYSVGKQITGPVVKITKAGAFVNIEEGIDGFIHVDDLSWTKRVKNPGSVLKAGEDVTLAIISVNKEERRIRLGMKQLSDDPWDSLSSKYSKGDILDGVISTKTDFGLFVKVEGDIEGLISVHQLPESEEKEDPAAIMESYKEGAEIKCAILDINPSRKRLSLSVKALLKSQQRKDMAKYIHDDKDENTTATLADFIK